MDRILNEGRVFINVLGNAIATIVVAKWEKGFDADRAREVLAGNLEFHIEDEDDAEPTAIEQQVITNGHASVTTSPARTSAHASS